MKAMTEKEEKALKLHNNFFTQPAIAIKAFVNFPQRFRVIYADGKEKIDFECGSITKEISNCLR